MNAGQMAANEAIMDMLHGSGTGTGFARHRAGKPCTISGRHSASWVSAMRMDPWQVLQ
jgi:hypothetical protein